MTRGGARPGAGRPKGQGKYREATKAMRIPVSMVDAVLGYIHTQGYCLPLYACAVQAGFPSPADDDVAEQLDLNQHLIKHPTATFFVRVAGDSMLNAGIHPGDILVVDRSLTVSSGKIVIAALDGQLTVKRWQQGPEGTFLLPDNDAYPAIELHEASEVVIWGVVTSVVHQL